MISPYKNTSRKIGVFKKVNNSLFIIIFGIFVLGMGLISTLGDAGTADFVDVKGTIVEIKDETVYVQYQVGRNLYVEPTNAYSSSYKVGQVIDVAYNPENPNEVIERTPFFTTILIVVGILIIFVGIYFIVTSIRKKKAFDALVDGESLPGEEYEEYVSEISISDIFPGFRPDTREDAPRYEYYFHFNGKLGQGHILETPDRIPIYEAKLTHFSLLRNCDYDFIDHRNGKVTSHKIGKTVTVGTGNIGSDSSFKFDGEDIFEILWSSGYSVVTSVGKYMASADYSIRYQGEEIGRIVSAGTAILPGVKSNKLTENLVSNGLYKVYSSDENVPIMFFYALAFARSQMMYFE